jgi:aminoglycoside phosphotransferase (APT) family kinase protein
VSRAEDCPTPLAAFAHPAEALRRLAGVAETRDHELLREALSLAVGTGPALHGDAAVANCIGDGRWIDFDLAAQGPPEADLATLAMRDRVHAQDSTSTSASTTMSIDSSSSQDTSGQRSRSSSNTTRTISSSR